MDEKTNIRLRDLIEEGKSGAQGQILFFLHCEKYRRAKGFEKDGFKDWTGALNALLKKIRRSRSGVMAKLAQVRLLLDSNKVSFEQLEKIGDANATMLCRLYRVKGLSAAWIKRAMTWDVEKFKAAILKVVKPKEEPRRHLTFVVVQSLYVEVQSLIGRLQTLAKFKTKEGALEFIVADYLTKDDSEILHQASENPDLTERLAKARQLELLNISEGKGSKSPKRKDGSRSTPKTSKAIRSSSRSGNGRMRSVSEISSPSESTSQEEESTSSSAAAEPTTTDVN